MNRMSYPNTYWSRRRLGLKVLASVYLSCMAGPINDSAAQPLPGFASLVADSVEVRAEPGFDKAITFVFKRAGLPVAVLDERKDWVRIEDTSGTTGWVAADMLSKRRTGIVLAPAAAAGEPARGLRAAARSTSNVLAYLEPGVIVGVVSCDGRTCRITTSGIRGFIDQDHLWGVTAGETIKE